VHPFQFKQFAITQERSAMKIGTDQDPFQTQPYLSDPFGLCSFGYTLYAW